jgi:hypothetical protein
MIKTIVFTIAALVFAYWVAETARTLMALTTVSLGGL